MTHNEGNRRVCTHSPLIREKRLTQVRDAQRKAAVVRGVGGNQAGQLGRVRCVWAERPARKRGGFAVGFHNFANSSLAIMALPAQINQFFLRHFLAEYSRLVFFVGDLFHPIDNLAVQSFLNGDMSHGRGGGSTMPMLLAGREPHDIAGPYLLDGSACALGPAAASRDDENLTEWMTMPSCPRAGLETDAGTLNQCGLACLKKRVDSYRTREPLGGPLGGGLRTNSFDFHVSVPSLIDDHALDLRGMTLTVAERAHPNHRGEIRAALVLRPVSLVEAAFDRSVDRFEE